MSDYAARIRAARAYAGLKQDELAERLGVDTNTIKRREAGTQNPKRGELLAIAAITGVPVSFMEHGFGETDEAEVLKRLDRIEALLAGADDLEAVRDYARSVVTELRAAEDVDGPAQPTPARGRDPRPEGQPKPRARSRRRS